MSYYSVRERRRYQAVMPSSAWPRGREPRRRARKRDAWTDLAEGLFLHAQGDAAAWARYALRLGTGATAYGEQAPDGTSWGVKTIVEYV